jgi:hypothetical protein
MRPINLMSMAAFTCWVVAANAQPAMEVPCTSAARTLVLVPAGQSNAANHGDAPYSAKSKGVINFDVDKNACFLAQDPLLGATSEPRPKGGSIWSRLGDLLIQTGRWDLIVIAPVAVGGSFMKDWATGGQYLPRLLKVIALLKQRGFPDASVLWIEGEADAAGMANGVVDVDGYKSGFSGMATSLRNTQFSGPIYVAIATICYGSPASPFAFGADLEKVTPAVRAAILRRQRALQEVQFDLTNPQANILRGPNLDLISAHSRWDGCHLNAYGQEVAAELWMDTLVRQADLLAGAR